MRGNIPTQMPDNNTVDWMVLGD
jgi:hypothetical protein